MVKTPKIIKKITEYLEGDREPGESAPADDSHITMGDVEPIVGEMPDPKLEPQGDDEEQEFEVEIAGTVRKVDQKTYNLVMEERASRAADEPAPELEPEPEPEPEPESFDATEFYSDPAAALKQVKDQAVTEATKQVSRRYAADKAQESFWGAFYKENPKLADEEMLVKMVMASNIKDLRNLSDGKAGRDKLAGLVEGEILRLANKQRGHQPPPNNTSRLEGGPAPNTPTTESSDNEASQNNPARPPSVGDALKDRKLKRQRAQRGEPTQLS